MTHPRSDAEILAAHPPEAVEAEVRRRYARASHQRRAVAPVVTTRAVELQAAVGSVDLTTRLDRRQQPRALVSRHLDRHAQRAFVVPLVADEALRLRGVVISHHPGEPSAQPLELLCGA